MRKLHVPCLEKLMSCESYYRVNNIYIIETDRFIFSRKAKWDHLLLAWKIQHLQNESSGSLNILSISKRTGRFTSSLLGSILLCLSTTIIDLKSKIQIIKFRNRTIKAISRQFGVQLLNESTWTSTFSTETELTIFYLVYFPSSSTVHGKRSTTVAVSGYKQYIAAIKSQSTTPLLLNSWYDGARISQSSTIFPSLSKQ